MPLAHAAPTGGQVVAGKGNISQSGSTTTVQQSTQTLSLNWQSFNIAPQETVDFVQPSSSSIAVNRIAGSNGSQILGHLAANGQVWLINPNGVVFGKGSEVNVGGLVASSLDIGNANAAGTKTFSGTGTGDIVNEGSISTSSGGYVALLGNHVSNQGTISARLGTVALGAGSAATLTFEGDSLVKMQVDQSTLNNLAANGGLIQAAGGRVLLSAGAQQALLASVVNNTGLIEARAVESHEGSITLLGGMTAGTVTVGGTLDASAPAGGNGGFIETSAAHVEIANAAKITTAAADGLYGSWLIDPQDFTVAPSGGDITGAKLSTELNSTGVTLQSSSGAKAGSGNVNLNDNVSWSANTALTLTASNNVDINDNLTASGATAGLVIKPNTANGADAASGTGVFNVGAGAAVTLSGSRAFLNIANKGLTLGTGSSINLPNVSPTSINALVINGGTVRVINSLGAAGSTTGTDLQGIEAALGGHFALGSNIDASATSGWNAGSGFAPIGTSGSPFTGSFDGLGHTISNLTIDRQTTSYVGLFGFAGTSSSLHNIGLVNANITGASYVGALAGFNSYGAINNAYSTGSVRGTGGDVGGLVGGNYGGTIGNSHSAATVLSTGTGTYGTGVGGLVGGNGLYGSVSNSYATGSVSGVINVGGLVGANTILAPISNSYATGTVTGSSYTGGLVGTNAWSVTNSYATGNVSGIFYVGGLVGYNSSYGGSIAGSHATGAVSGVAGGGSTPTHAIGGLAGGNSGEIDTSYATGKVTGSSASLEVGGLVGSNYGDINNSYATGAVSGYGRVGGLVGQGICGFYGCSNLVNSYALGNVSGTTLVGGLAGLHYGSVTTSYAAGSVTGSTYVGGLVGLNRGNGFFNSGAISNSYATGSVTGDAVVGGLIGLNDTGGALTNSYSTGRVSASSYFGGLIGYGYGSVKGSFWDTQTSGVGSSFGGIGMTTAQMQNQSNFTSATSANGNVNPGWSFPGTWVMYNGHTYPLLAAFLTPLTVTANSGSVIYDGAVQAGALGVSYSTTPNANLLGAVSYSSTPGGAVNVGTYTITPGGLYSNQQGYNISYATGNLTIDQLPSVTWTGGKTGNWSSASNWAGGAIPDFANVAAVTIPVGVTVTYDSGVPGSTSLSTLTSNGTVAMAAGTLSTSGNFSTVGYRQTGGTLDVGGTLSIHSTAGAVTLGDIDAGALSITSKAGAVSQLASTTLDVAGSTSVTADNGVTGAGDVRYNVTLANTGNDLTGAVTAEGDTISIADSKALTAKLTAKESTTLRSVGAMHVSGTVGTNLTTTATGGAAGKTIFGVTTVGNNLKVTSTGTVTKTTPTTALKVDGAGTNTANSHVTVNGIVGATIK